MPRTRLAISHDPCMKTTSRKLNYILPDIEDIFRHSRCQVYLGKRAETRPSPLSASAGRKESGKPSARARYAPPPPVKDDPFRTVRGGRCETDKRLYRAGEPSEIACSIQVRCSFPFLFLPRRTKPAEAPYAMQPVRERLAARKIYPPRTAPPSSTDIDRDRRSRVHDHTRPAHFMVRRRRRKRPVDPVHLRAVIRYFHTGIDRGARDTYYSRIY